MRRRTPLAVIAAASLAVALAACSGGSGSKGSSGSTSAAGPTSSAAATTDDGSTGSTANAAALVQSASTAGDTVKSAQIKVDTTIGGKATTISGSVSYQPVALDMKLQVQGQSLREVLVGKTIYMKIPGLPGGKPWASISLKNAGKASGLDLSSMLDNTGPSQTVDLLKKSGDLKLVGSDTVAGVPTKHLSGTVDMSKALATLGAKGQKQWKALVDSSGVKNVHIDLWVNDQNIPLKTVETYDSSLGKATTTMTLSKINAPVKISAPPKSQVKSLL